jgi:dipeptidyl aminopeptidase/acylaminoacyl peptidase
MCCSIIRAKINCWASASLERYRKCRIFIRNIGSIKMKSNILAIFSIIVTIFLSGWSCGTIEQSINKNVEIMVGLKEVKEKNNFLKGFGVKNPSDFGEWEPYIDSKYSLEFRPSKKHIINKYHYEDINIEALDGENVYGWYVKSNNENKEGTVICIHGKGTNIWFDFWKNKYLLEKGFDIVVYNSRFQNHIDEDEYYWYLKEDLLDFNAVLNYLKNEKNISLVCIYGLSKGGIRSLYAASQNTSSIAAVAIDGGYIKEYEIWLDALLKDPYFKNKQKEAEDLLNEIIEKASKKVGYSIMDYDSYKAIDILDKNDIPIFFIHSTNDEIVNNRNSKLMFEHSKNSNKVLWEIPNAEHCEGMMVYPEDYSTKVVDFFKRNINIKIRHFQ